jgi:MFS family permease
VAAGIVFLAAAAVLVLEVVALRLVGPYVGITLQTSSAVIGVSLAAIAYGAWVGGAFADRADPRRLLPRAFALAALATALTLPLVRWLGEVLRGTGVLGVLALAALAVFIPGALLSAITPIVVKLQLADVRRTGRVVGSLSSIGTLGGITATLVTGFVLVAALPSSTILLGLAGLLAVAAGLLWLLQRPDGQPSAAAPLARVRGLGSLLGRNRGAAGFAVLALTGAGLTSAVPTPCDVETAYQCARIVVDPDRPGGRTLLLNGAPHSYVDLNDPTYLQFGYIQWLGQVVDHVAAPGRPIRALHIGGGGFTLPGYVTATRPGSTNRVLELDGALVRLDEQRLGVTPGPNLSIVVGDARVSMTREAASTYDLVIGDAFGHLAVPWHLTTREFVTDIARVLRPGGVYALNVIDYPPDKLIRAELATIMAVFAHVALIAPNAALAGRTGSNFVLVASDAPLPDDLLGPGVATVPRPATLVDGDALLAYRGTAMILTDDYAPVDQLLGHP